MGKQRWKRGACVGVLLLGACTHLDPITKQETLVVHSFPEGATFTTDTGETGTTPARVGKESGRVMRVRFELQGYTTQEVAVHQDEPMLGTLVLGDLLRVLQPDAPRAVTVQDGEVHVALERGEGPVAAADADFDALLPKDR